MHYQLCGRAVLASVFAVFGVRCVLVVVKILAYGCLWHRNFLVKL
jgi:hypothetical protein